MAVKIHVPASKAWEFFVKNKPMLEKEQAIIAENDETEYAVCMTVELGMPQFNVFKGDRQIEQEGAVDAEDCRDTAQRLFIKHLFPVTVVDEKAIPHGEQLHISEIDDDAWEYPRPQGTRDPFENLDIDLDPLEFGTDPSGDFALDPLEDDDEDEDFNEYWSELHEEISIPWDEVPDQKLADDIMYIRYDEIQQKTEDLLETILETGGDPVNQAMLEDVIEHLLQYLSAVHHECIWYPTTVDGEDGVELFETYPYSDMAEGFTDCEFK